MEGNPVQPDPRGGTLERTPVFRRDSVVLAPLVDSLAVDGFAALFRERGGALCSLIPECPNGCRMFHEVIFRQNFGDCKPEGNSDDNKPALPQICGMVDSKAYAEAAGARLRKLRLAVAPDESIGTFADRTQSNEDQLSAWERGLALVRPWYITELKTKFGVTQDWIFDGKELGMAPDLMALIRTVPETVEIPPAERRPRRRGGSRGRG